MVYFLHVVIPPSLVFSKYRSQQSASQFRGVIKLQWDHTEVERNDRDFGHSRVLKKVVLLSSAAEITFGDGVTPA